MAKKKIKDFDVTVDTEKVDVHVKKKGSDFDVDVKTQKVEVELKSEGENKTFNMDGKRIDSLASSSTSAQEDHRYSRSSTHGRLSQQQAHHRASHQ